MFYQLIRPFLFQFDAENAHHLTMKTASLAQATLPSLLHPFFRFSDERLKQTLWGITFENPIGLAAGFDKNAAFIPFWYHLGFGFCEVGSVTAQASEGNPLPRAFRLPEDKALINRMGLNNEGAVAVANRLAKQNNFPLPVGINLAKTHSPTILGKDAIADFCESFERLAPYATYVALNISCPNTAEGKTFEEPSALEALLSAIENIRVVQKWKLPVLVKFSPPASLDAEAFKPYDVLLELVNKYQIDGLIATNTASDRVYLTTSPKRIEEIGKGGLSGVPLQKRSTALIEYLYKKTTGNIPIIGVGGIDSVESAYEKICAGASLLQLYTGLVYQGPGLVKRINEGLIKYLKRDGLGIITEAIGKSVA